jgi:hypothetical protein
MHSRHNQKRTPVPFSSARRQAGYVAFEMTWCDNERIDLNTREQMNISDFLKLVSLPEEALSLLAG